MSETHISDTHDKPILVDPGSDPFLRICPRCGDTFNATRISQIYCFKKACQRDKAQKARTNHAARAEARLAHQRRFVAIDGEGITQYDQAGNVLSHDYVLLGATGCKPLHKNGERLTTSEIFYYLYYEVFVPTSTLHPDAVYVGFYLNYDWGQSVRDLPKSRAEMLFTKKGIAARRRQQEHAPPWPVYWRVDDNLEWEIDFLGDKRFKLRPYTGPKRDFDRRAEKNRHPWMYINDAFAYFQCSFLKAINPEARKSAGLSPLISDNDYRLIEAGKKRRPDAEFDLNMIEYNQAECRALSALMTELNRGIVATGVHLSKHQYFGPGPVAQQYLNLLNKANSIDLTNKAIHEKIPAQVRRAAQFSYFGGWFEIFFHGIYPGTCHEYDINSAYPWVMSALPCLLHGKWIKGRGDPHDDKRFEGRRFGTGADARQTALCLIKAHVKGSNSRIGAMLHRDRQGHVLRPQMTAGRYWLHEMDAAQRAELVDTVEYQQWHAYLPDCDCAPPLASLAELYDGRLAVGKNSPEGVAKKLIYNSIYGKFAQSIGEPRYGNSIYASLITAGCRCLILDFIATHPQKADSVLMIATDGIYVTSPHPRIEVSATKLGAWDHKERTNLCIFKSGTYWDDTAREKIRSENYDSLGLKTRGVPLRALAQRIFDFDQAFQSWKPGDPWPSAEVLCEFAVISPRLALSRGKWRDCGKVTNSHTIKVNSDPYHKRVARGPGWSKPWPVAPGGTIKSTPYSHTFGEKDEQGLVFDHPDGDLAEQLIELFKDVND